MDRLTTVEDLSLDDVFLILRDTLQGLPLSDALEGIEIAEVEDGGDRLLIVTLSDDDGGTRAFEINEYGVNLNGVD